MSPEVAAAFRDALAAQFKREIQATLRVIAAIPIYCALAAQPATRRELAGTWPSRDRAARCVTRADFAGLAGRTRARHSPVATLYRDARPRPSRPCRR